MYHTQPRFLLTPTFHQTVSKGITDVIKEKCKVMVQVTIGQINDQGVKITNCCLWDTATDNYTTVSFQK